MNEPTRDATRIRLICPPGATDRLVFREMESRDFDFVLGMVSDPVVMRHYPSTLDRAGAAAWLERQLMRYERDGVGFWVVSLRDGGEAIGQVGLLVQDVEGIREPEIGYLLRPEFHGRGLATEAACAVRDFTFTRLGLDHVISLIRPVNEASRRVAMRLGMEVSRRTTFHGLEHDVWEIRRQEPSAVRIDD